MSNQKLPSFFPVIFILLLSVSISACSPTKSDVIKDFKATEGEYNLIVFAKRNINEEVKATNTMLIDLQNIYRPQGVFDVNVKENKQKASALKIEQYPMYVVMDFKGIVLQTTDQMEVEKYAFEILRKRLEDR